MFGCRREKTKINCEEPIQTIHNSLVVQLQVVVWTIGLKVKYILDIKTWKEFQMKHSIFTHYIFHLLLCLYRTKYTLRSTLLEIIWCLWCFWFFQSSYSYTNTVRYATATDLYPCLMMENVQRVHDFAWIHFIVLFSAIPPTLSNCWDWLLS